MDAAIRRSRDSGFFAWVMASTCSRWWVTDRAFHMGSSPAALRRPFNSAGASTVRGASSSVSVTFTRCPPATAAVRSMLAAMPSLASVRGPHGLTLMHHARAGGEIAQGVVDLLAGVPESDVPYATVPNTDTAAYIGSYRFGPGADEVAEVSLEGKDAALLIRRKGGFARSLFHLGEHRFHSVGAPDTSVVFIVESGRGTRLSINTPAPLIEAARE